jgi:hypothetical protein
MTLNLHRDSANGHPYTLDMDPSRTIEVARRWLTLILVDHDLSAAWPWTAPEYRLALIQAIIFLNENDPMLLGYERDVLARGLAEAGPDHPLWASFAGLLTEEFSAILGPIDAGALDAGSAEPVGDNYELVLFWANDAVGADDLYARGVLVTMRDEQWLVAGLSGRPATPGWPPDLGY